LWHFNPLFCGISLGILAVSDYN
jgi:hypothetical protein